MHQEKKNSYTTATVRMDICKVFFPSPVILYAEHTEHTALCYGTSSKSSVTLINPRRCLLRDPNVDGC